MELATEVRSDARRPRGVYVVGDDGRQRSEIVSVLKRVTSEVRYARALDDLVVSEMRDSAAVIVLVDSARSDVLAPESLHKFRLQDAACVVCLATEARSRSLHELAALARAGLDAIYVTEDPTALKSLCLDVARHLKHALPRSVVHGALPNESNDAAVIVALCLRLGDRPHTAEDVATWLDWDRKTIWRRLADARLRPLHDLLDLGRLVHVALQLDTTRASISAIARSLDIDTSTMRRLCKRETGYTPAKLRDHGAVKTTIKALKIRRE